MKKLLVISLLAFTNTAFSDDWNDAYKPFNATKRFTDKTEITWRVVDDVVKACNEEGHKRFKNFKGLGTTPAACAVWEKDKCLIITSKRPNMHELGHEVRHCFQGHWHD